MEYLPGKRAHAVAPVSPMEQRLAFDEDPAISIKGHDLRTGKRGWTYSYYDPAAHIKPPSQTEVIYRAEGGKAPEYVLKKPAVPVTGATTTTVGTGAPNKLILTQHAGTANPLVQSITSITRGEAPHNAELLRILEISRNALAEERAKAPLLTPKGKQLATDAENFFLALETVLKEKNSDEIMQRMFMHTAYAATDVAKVGTTAAATSAPNLKHHAMDIISLSRTLITEIATSGEFRSLLIDCLDWLRLALWSGVKKSAPPLGQSLKEDLKKGNLRLSNTVQTLKDVANPKKTLKSAPAAESFESHYNIQTSAPGITNVPVEVTSRIRLITTDPNPHIEVLDGAAVHVEGQKREQLKREMAIKLRELIRRFNANPQFKQSAKQLLKVMRKLSAQATSVTSQTTGAASHNIASLGQDLKELIMRFSGGVSLDPLIENLTNLNTAMRSDPETLALMREFREFVLNMFKHPELLDDDTQLNVMTNFIDRFRTVGTSPTYMKPLKSSIKEITKVIQGFAQDAATSNLLRCGTKLVSDLAMDNSGKLSFYALRESTSQLRYLLMPVILKQLEHVALPKIEGITPAYNYSVDNIMFSGTDIFPEHIYLTLETDVDFDVRHLSSDYSKAELKLRILNVRSMFENIRFYFQRKRFPKVHDEGTLDVGLLGAGTSLSIDWVIESYKGVPWQFSVKKATCSIDSLDLNFKEAHHSFIDRTAVKLFKGRIKKQLEIQIANKLVDVGSSVSALLNKLFATTLTRTGGNMTGIATAPLMASPLMGQPQLMMPTGPFNAVRPGYHYPHGVKPAHYEGYFPWANWYGYVPPNATLAPNAMPTTGVASTIPLGTTRPMRG